MSSIRQCGNHGDQRTAKFVYEHQKEARWRDADTMATRSLSGMGRNVPGHICDVSRDSGQQWSRLCCSISRVEKVPEVQRYYFWCWLRAGGHRDVWRMGKASSWACQGDRSSSRRHHIRQSLSVLPSSASFRRHSARERVLRSWDFPEVSRRRRIITIITLETIFLVTFYWLIIILIIKIIICNDFCEHHLCILMTTRRSNCLLVW